MGDEHNNNNNNTDENVDEKTDQNTIKAEDLATSKEKDDSTNDADKENLDMRSEDKRRKDDRRKGDRRSGIDRREDYRRSEDEEPIDESVPKQKASILHRVVGKLIDIFIFAAFYKTFGDVGGAMGVLYLLIADGVRNGASVGKHIVRLRVVKSDGKLIGLYESIMRNLTVAFAFGLLVIPAIGWILFFTLGVLVVAVETYFVMHDPVGARIGDIIAQTVVEELPQDED